MDGPPLRATGGKTSLNSPPASPVGSSLAGSALVSLTSLETAVPPDPPVSAGSTEKAEEEAERTAGSPYDDNLGPDGYFLEEDHQKKARQQETNNKIRGLLSSFKSSYSRPASPALRVGFSPSHSEVEGGEREQENASQASTQAPAEEFLSLPPHPSKGRPTDEKGRVAASFFRGDSDTGKDQEATREGEDKPPWFPGKQEGWHTLDFFHRLHEECFEFLRWIQPTEEDQDKRAQVLARITAVAQMLWPRCVVCPFGSYYTGLSLPYADLDICVYIEAKPPLQECFHELAAVDTNRDLPVSTQHGKSPSTKRRLSSPPSTISSSATSRYEAYGKFASLAEKLTPGSEELRAAEQSLSRLGYTPKQRRDRGVLYLRRLAASLSSCKVTVPRRSPGGVGSRPSSSLSATEERPMIHGLYVISSARVPICRFVDTATNVKVDVCVDQPSSVLTSIYVRLQLLRYPLLRPLMLLNKAALRVWGLNEPFKGGVGSYLLFVMILSFLQVNHRLYDRENYSRYSIGHAFFEFLQYYGVAFNYCVTGLSVRDKGRLFPKQTRQWLYPHEWRWSMVRKPASPSGVEHDGDEKFLLAAESPLEPDRDLGRGAHQMPRVRWEWRRAYTVLAHRLRQEASPGLGLCSAEEESLLRLVFNDSDCSHWKESPPAASPRSSLVGKGEAALDGHEEAERPNGKTYTSQAGAGHTPPQKSGEALPPREGVCGLRAVTTVPPAALLSREKRGIENLLLFGACSLPGRSWRIERNRRGMKLLRKKLKALKKQASRVGASSEPSSGDGQSSDTAENEPGGVTDGTSLGRSAAGTWQDEDSTGCKEGTAGRIPDVVFSEEAVRGRSLDHLHQRRKRGRAGGDLSCNSDDATGGDQGKERTLRGAGSESEGQSRSAKRGKRIQGGERWNRAASRKETVSTAGLINLCSSSSDSSSQGEQENAACSRQGREKRRTGQKERQMRKGPTEHQAAGCPDQTHALHQGQRSLSSSEASAGEAGDGTEDGFRGKSEAYARYSRTLSDPRLTDGKVPGQNGQSTRCRKNAGAKKKVRGVITLSDDDDSLSGSDLELWVRDTGHVSGPLNSKQVRADASSGSTTKTKVSCAPRTPTSAKSKVRVSGERENESLQTAEAGSWESPCRPSRSNRVSAKEKDKTEGTDGKPRSQLLQSFDLGSAEAEKAANCALLHLQQRRATGRVWDADSSEDCESV